MPPLPTSAIRLSGRRDATRMFFAARNRDDSCLVQLRSNIQLALGGQIGLSTMALLLTTITRASKVRSEYTKTEWRTTPSACRRIIKCPKYQYVS